MSRKFRLQLIEEQPEGSGQFKVLASGIAELGALDLKKDFGIEPFQMMAEQLLKEVEQNSKND